MTSNHPIVAAAALCSACGAALAQNKPAAGDLSPQGKTGKADLQAAFDR